MDGSWWRVLIKHGPLDKGMANHFSILALRILWTVWKGKTNKQTNKQKTRKYKQPRLVGVQYAAEETQRSNSRRNEEAEPKQKWCSVVDVSGGESKVQCYKVQYCIGTWNVRSMNQGKLEVVKEEMARMNRNILGNIELQRTGISSVQFSSVAQSCPILCDPMNCSMPGLPVHHQLPEFTQTHVHRVSDAIQSSHPLSSPSSPAPNPSQHQSLFQWVNSSHEVAKVLELQL